MKTTLELPDDLYRKAKATAALRGETLTSLLGQALELIVARTAISPKPRSRSAQKRAPVGLREERIRKWREDEAEFLKQMRGPELDKRSAAEIIREGRRG